MYKVSVPGLVAGAIVTAGVLLWMFVSPALIWVAGIGAFGPGILREIGWLKDHDEFQRHAAHRAGYHAYLAGGAIVVLLETARQLAPDSADGSSEVIRLVLLTLWLAWVLSSLLSYWGARRTVSTILLIFGSFWALFAIATIIGDLSSDIETSEKILGVLAAAGLTAAFLVPAWTVHRWPRATGAALLLITVAVTVVFLQPWRHGALQWSTRGFTDLLLAGPLLVSAVALLAERPDPEDEAEVVDQPA